ncbi:MAG TPA: hypothetical protein VFY29_11880, partial [Terriglobia bacterium]|nr:hypothetical protein [Terriglobia bacterium]
QRRRHFLGLIRECEATGQTCGRIRADISATEDRLRELRAELEAARRSGTRIAEYRRELERLTPGPLLEFIGRARSETQRFTRPGAGDPRRLRALLAALTAAQQLRATVADDAAAAAEVERLWRSIDAATFPAPRPVTAGGVHDGSDDDFGGEAA